MTAPQTLWLLLISPNCLHVSSPEDSRSAVRKTRRRVFIETRRSFLCRPRDDLKRCRLPLTLSAEQLQWRLHVVVSSFNLSRHQFVMESHSWGVTWRWRRRVCHLYMDYYLQSDTLIRRQLTWCSVLTNTHIMLMWTFSPSIIERKSSAPLTADSWWTPPPSDICQQCLMSQQEVV